MKKLNEQKLEFEKNLQYYMHVLPESHYLECNRLLAAIENVQNKCSIWTWLKGLFNKIKL